LLLNDFIVDEWQGNLIGMHWRSYYVSIKRFSLDTAIELIMVPYEGRCRWAR